MKTVVLEVRTLEDSLRDVAEIVAGGSPDPEVRIAFETPELLWKVLTPKRWELLKALCGAGAMPIREAARRVGRDVKGVHTDVTALLHAGLLERTDRGIVFPYEEIKVEFILRAA